MFFVFPSFLPRTRILCVLLLVFAVVTNRATPPSHAASPLLSHHVLAHRRGGPRRSARFRSAARGGHLSRLPFCLPCCYSTHDSSIGRQHVRHTTNHSLAHSPDLRGRMIGIGRHATEQPARRRRLSELLQWQLLMRGAPHIWDCGPPAPLSPLGRLIVVSRLVLLACEARPRPSAKYPPARAQSTTTPPVQQSSYSPCLLVLHPLTSAPPVTSLSCHQCLVSSAVSHVNGHLSPVG